MTNRKTLLPTAIVALLVLGACGSSADEIATEADPTSAESASEPTAVPVDETAEEAPATEAPEPETAVVAEPADDDCNQILPAATVESALGVPVIDVNGGGGYCYHVFADDAVGSFAVWSGATAEAAMAELLPKFEADETASANGVLLDDGRGFVHDATAVVQGDSGRVYRFDAPENIDVADIQTALMGIVDVLVAS